MLTRIKPLVGFFFIGILAQNASANQEATWWTLQQEGPPVSVESVRIKTKAKKLYTLSLADFESKVALAPTWQEQPLQSYGLAIELPNPDGQMVSFRIASFSVMEPSLQAQYPSIRCFTGQGRDGSVLKLDITPHGVHAMVSGLENTYFIDPYLTGNTNWYQVYFKSDFIRGTGKPIGEFLPLGPDGQPINVDEYNGATSSKLATPNGAQRKQYRIAIAASKEYTNFHGGTVVLALAAINTSLNRVNSVYERDFAVRMILVANNNLIIYTNSNPGPYTDQIDAGITINQNQTNINSVIGAANYDIGHIFTTGAGGLAGLGVVCNNTNKARGVTGIPSPVGDPFDIDYVAHEIGHQFGGTHTFNGSTGSCGGNRTATTAYEPGSGTTIMAYAGICAPQDLQNNSDAHFHGGSYEQMLSFITSGGSTCAVNVSTSNSPPSVEAGPTFFIPRNTPFTLTGLASDANTGDTLTYCWESVDLGPQGPPDDVNATAAPIFRSFPPTVSPSRTFPKWSDILANTQTIGEVLPNVARSLRFLLSVRDNRPAGGGTNNDTVSIQVTSSAPFQVTAPNTAVTWTVFSTQTITWNRASTHLTPISCDTVRILLSLNGGLSWPIVLSDGTPNDGSHTINIPNNPSNTCRIMVMGKGNIFFDVSNVNFTIPVPTIPDFALSLLNTTNATCTQDSALFRIRIASLLGFNGSVSLSISALPAGVTGKFYPDTTTAPDTVDLYIRALASATPGTYSFTITGIGSSGTKTAIGQITVVNAVPAAAALTTPANNAVNQPLKPGFQWSAVSGAVSYQFQLSTSSTFGTLLVNESGIPSNGFVIPIFLTGNTTYYWRVRAVNPCGNGAFSSTFNFLTENVICVSFTNNTPLTIPSAGTGTYFSTIQVPVGNVIRDVNVRNIRGTHTRVSDLSISLLSAEGFTVPLMPQSCTATAQNFFISFDQAASSSAFPCPPTDSLTYRPAGNLNLFNNQIACGTWTLIVVDNVSGQGGVLQGWELDICYEACTPSQNVQIISITPGVSRCAGQFVNIQVPYTSPSSISYQWLKNGQPIAGQAGTGTGNGTLTLALTNLAPADSGNYSVAITNCCSTVVSPVHTLLVRPTPPQPTITQVGFTLQSSATSGNQWFRNGNILPGQNQQTITPVLTGNYTVIVTLNSCASIPSLPFNVTQVGFTPDVLTGLVPILYPSPAKEALQLALQGANETTQWKVRVTVYTAKGQIVRNPEEVELTNEPLVIPVHTLASGMYYLELRTHTGTQSIKWIKE
jgi:subtilisin-like proprotein convertase family protein